MIWIAPSFPIFAVFIYVFKSDFIIVESFVSGSGRVVTLPSLSLDQSNPWTQGDIGGSSARICHTLRDAWGTQLDFHICSNSLMAAR